MKKICLGLLCTVATLPALGQDISNAGPQEKGYTAEIEAGFSKATGNSDTTSWRGRGALDYSTENWRHSAELKSGYAKDDGNVSEENYFGSYQLDRTYSEINYAYGLVSYENDRFASLSDVVTGSVGYGHHFTLHDKGALKLEAGPGYRIANDADDEFIFRGNAEYKWDISDTSAFTQTLSSEIGEDNTITKAESALTANIIGALAMKLTFSVTHQSDPAIKNGVENDSTDTKTSLTLLYKI